MNTLARNAMLAIRLVDAAPVNTLARNAVLAIRLLVVLALGTSGAARAADWAAVIARVKPSVVAVGTYERMRSPPFQFRGTGFAVGDGRTIVTNSHVLPGVVDPSRNEVVAIMVPSADGARAQVREVRRVATDADSDLALLRLDGDPLPPLKLRDSDTVQEGQEILMTGYPIGAVLGPYAATHRGIIAAIAPIAIPQRRAADLDSAVVHRLASGAFPIFQLDATALPGNSGSPIYDPATGEVLGIVNMVFIKSTKEAALSQPSGITYAVPSRNVQALLRALRDDTRK